MEKKIKYIEKSGRKLVIEFFADGQLKAVHEWTGATSAAFSVKLEGNKHREAVELLCNNYIAKAYHNELDRLRRAERRKIKFKKEIK